MMALVLIGTMAFAQRGQWNDGPRGDRQPNRATRGEMMAQRLDLTEQQEEQIEVLRTAHLKVTADTKSQLDIKRAELEAAIKGERPVDKLIGEIGNLENKLLDARVKHRMAVRNILNEDQKLRFDQFQGRNGGTRGNCGNRGK